MTADSPTVGGVEGILGQVRDALTVKRVFGDPYERDGALVIPVASVRGGAGGGSDGQADAGLGGGFGVSARPVGVYRIREEEVSWHPAVDTTRVIVGGQLVGIVALLVLRSIVKVITARSRAARTAR